MKLGLACAGGGIEGAVYEIGALCAIEDAIEGVDFCDLHVYVGVSAGALVTSCLANGISARQMSLAILSHKSDVHPISPSTFFTPAYGEYLKKVLRFPGLVSSLAWNYISRPGDNSFGGTISRFTELLPVGLFDNSPLRDYLEKNFEKVGGTNDFKELKSKLRIVATDLNSSKSVVFGGEGYQDVPISVAVQASTALPVVYKPVEINKRFYIDGVAQKTVHASVALDEQADLVFCINPIVPFEAIENEEDQLEQVLLGEGLPGVLSQTFRTMIHSRMTLGIDRYKYAYTGKDLLVFEPLPSDYRMFFSNIFSFSSRREVCEFAYQSMRRNILARRDEIGVVLKKHGLSFSEEFLSNKERTLYTPPTNGNGYKTGKRLKDALAELSSIVDKLEATPEPQAV